MRRTSLQLFDLNIIEASTQRKLQQNWKPIGRGSCKSLSRHFSFYFLLAKLIRKNLFSRLRLIAFSCCVYFSCLEARAFSSLLKLHYTQSRWGHERQRNKIEIFFFFFSLRISAITPLHTHWKRIEIFIHLLPLAGNFREILRTFAEFRDDFSCCVLHLGAMELFALSLEINKLKWIFLRL